MWHFSAPQVHPTSQARRPFITILLQPLNGHSVVARRTEAPSGGWDAYKTISLPVMGIVEVHGGKITAWRDYFDLSQFASQLPGRA